MNQMKRLIVALPIEDYRQLADVAAQEVREPEQQVAYFVRAGLDQRHQPKKQEAAVRT